MEERIEIITIGKEILIGRTQDTNSHWLCRRIIALGGFVKRVIIVDDEIKEIVEALNIAFKDKSRVIITTGGLGPTSDDKTLEAVAKFASCKLNINQEALEFVKSRYKYFYEKGYVSYPEITPEREKMAILPEGSKLLSNPVGAAPGVALKHKGCWIFSIPGVPKEMKAIFENSIINMLKDIIGKKFFLEKTIKSGIEDESKLAPLLKILEKEFPAIYIISHPLHFAYKVDIELSFSSSGDEKEEVKRRIDNSINRFKELIEGKHQNHDGGR